MLLMMHLGTSLILGTSVLFITIPLQMASDDERIRLAQVIGLAYGVKLQHANPPNLATIDTPPMASGLSGLGSIPL